MAATSTDLRKRSPATGSEDGGGGLSRAVAFGPSSPVCVDAVRSDETLTEGTGTMAYLMTHFWPGGTEEQYQSMLAVVHPAEGLPTGRPRTSQGRLTAGI